MPQAPTSAGRPQVHPQDEAATGAPPGPGPAQRLPGPWHNLGGLKGAPHSSPAAQTPCSPCEGLKGPACLLLWSSQNWKCQKRWPRQVGTRPRAASLPASSQVLLAALPPPLGRTPHPSRTAPPRPWLPRPLPTPLLGSQLSGLRRVCKVGTVEVSPSGVRCLRGLWADLGHPIQSWSQALPLPLPLPLPPPVHPGGVSPEARSARCPSRPWRVALRLLSC